MEHAAVKSHSVRGRLLLVMTVLALLAMACNMPSQAAATPVNSFLLLTQVAQTMAARNGPTDAAATGQPTTAGQATPAGQATAVIQPTAAGQANAGVATATKAGPVCDDASFIQDVTIPDGTKVVTGQSFVKTWRLQNVGQCTWNKNYALVFTGGDALGAPAVINLQGEVPPNALVDLSVEMKAPAQPGKYYGDWKMRNAAGTQFGVSGGMPFFVQIEAVVLTLTPTITVTPTITLTPTIGSTATLTPTSAFTLTPPVNGIKLDFVASVCKASWRTQAGALTCPGTSGDSRGYVMRLENPVLETGANEAQPVLLTVPQTTVDGAITGTYAGIPIASGDHFQATLGCLSGQPKCSVIYQLNYSIAGAAPQNLQQWTQTTDGSIQGVDVDLSSLAGKTVDLILVVLANGSPDQDMALWINPRVVIR